MATICAPFQHLRAPQFALLAMAAAIVAAYGVALHEQVASDPWFPVALPRPVWPFFALGSPLVCLLALICGFLVCADRHGARGLLWVIAWSGLAYAVYGIAAHLIDPTKVLWRVKPAYVANVTSTFINRNTAAVYFGSCSVVCLALLCDRLRRFLPHGPIEWRRLPNRVLMGHAARDRHAIRDAVRCVWPPCSCRHVHNASRAGVLLSLLALVVTFTIYFHRDLPRRTVRSRGCVGWEYCRARSAAIHGQRHQCPFRHPGCGGWWAVRDLPRDDADDC